MLRDPEICEWKPRHRTSVRQLILLRIFFRSLGLSVKVWLTKVCHFRDLGWVSITPLWAFSCCITPEPCLSVNDGQNQTGQYELDEAIDNDDKADILAVLYDFFLTEVPSPHHVHTYASRILSVLCPYVLVQSHAGTKGKLMPLQSILRIRTECRV